MTREPRPRARQGLFVRSWMGRLNPEPALLYTLSWGASLRARGNEKLPRRQADETPRSFFSLLLWRDMVAGGGLAHVLIYDRCRTTDSRTMIVVNSSLNEDEFQRFHQLLMCLVFDSVV